VNGPWVKLSRLPESHSGRAGCVPVWEQARRNIEVPKNGSFVIWEVSIAIGSLVEKSYFVATVRIVRTAVRRLVVVGFRTSLLSQLINGGGCGWFNCRFGRPRAASGLTLYLC